MNEETFFKALETGEIDRAAEVLDKMKPGLPRTRTLYLEGILLEAGNELEEALKKFNMALVLHLSDPSIWLAKANVLKELGKLEMARRAVDRACRLAHGNPAAHLLYGDILYRMKDYAKASLQIDIAIDLAPKDSEVLTLKGILVSILDQDYREALKFFDSALDSDEENNKAWTNRGIALRQIGDRDGALYSFQKALILDEEDKVARKMLEKMGAEKYIVKSKGKEKRRSVKTPRYFADASSAGPGRDKMTFKRTRAPLDDEFDEEEEPEEDEFLEDEEEDEWEDLEDEEEEELEEEEDEDEYENGEDMEDEFEEDDEPEDDFEEEEYDLPEEEDEELEDEEGSEQYEEEEEEEPEEEEDEDEYENGEDMEDEFEEGEELDEDDFLEDDEEPEDGEWEDLDQDEIKEPPEPEVKMRPPAKKGFDRPRPRRKGEKPGKKLHLDCPRCGESFDIMVKGRTNFKCPSCGLSGEID